MQIKKKKGIDGRLDDAWRKAVKLLAGNKCEYCGAMDKQIHAHHIYTRAKKSTRWDVKNGIALCAGHHVLSHKMSAHQTPREFNRWLDQYKGEDFMTRLEWKANQIAKLSTFEKEYILHELNEIIKTHEN